MSGETTRVSEHRLRRRVQFHETDGAGIVHFSYSCVLTIGNDPVAAGTMTIVCARAAPGERLRAVPFPAAIIERLEAVPAEVRL